MKEDKNLNFYCYQSKYIAQLLKLVKAPEEHNQILYTIKFKTLVIILIYIQGPLSRYRTFHCSMVDMLILSFVNLHHKLLKYTEV